MATENVNLANNDDAAAAADHHEAKLDRRQQIRASVKRQLCKLLANQLVCCSWCNHRNGAASTPNEFNELRVKVLGNE